MPRVFLDLEFTSLHQHAEPVSLGLVTDSGPQTFYAEFTDYNPSLVAIWVQEMVLPKLRLTQLGLHHGAIEGSLEYRGTRRMVVPHLAKWLYELWDDAGQHEPIEFWGDVLSHDWVIFCELFGGSLNLPQYVSYIPFDIATVFKLQGIDPDINRAEFAHVGDDSQRHDALQDAALTALCYQALMETPAAATILWVGDTPDGG